jgi:hypothetical protein
LINGPGFLAASKPEMADDIYSGKHWQVIGIWRPLKPIKHDPFAVLDATIVEGDYASLPRLYNGKPVNILIMKYRAGHKWCYLHEQQPDETLVFMHFDSDDKKGVISHVGHTAFRIPGTFDLPPIESIEFRAIEVY